MIPLATESSSRDQNADNLQARPTYDAANTEPVMVLVPLCSFILVAQAKSARIAADNDLAYPKNMSRPTL